MNININILPSDIVRDMDCIYFISYMEMIFNSLDFMVNISYQSKKFKIISSLYSINESKKVDIYIYIIIIIQKQMNQIKQVDFIYLNTIKN